MSLDLHGETMNGMPMPVYTFNSDNPALRPVELVELWKQAVGGVPSRVAIKTNGQVHTVWDADNLLGIAFGMLLASQEEKEGSLAVVSGSVNQHHRRTQGDPVFQFTGTIDQKLQFLENLHRVIPRDVMPPITLRYLDHEMHIDAGYELEQVKAGLRLSKKP